jgi:hypothetical protein
VKETYDDHVVVMCRLSVLTHEMLKRHTVKETYGDSRERGVW